MDKTRDFDDRAAETGNADGAVGAAGATDIFDDVDEKGAALTDEQRKTLYRIMRRQDERGRDSSTLLSSEFKEALDLYGPLLDSGLMTYERFGSGRDAIVSLLLQPAGILYCKKHEEELAAL